MSIWNEIYNNINHNISLVCLFIGSSMISYNEITDENNQQYPCFLNKFKNKKLIILIDPHLESNLKIEEFFMLKGNPLIIDKIIYSENKISVRVLHNNEVIVYALNEAIDYIKHLWVDKHELIDTPKIYTIINICLNNKIKLILQDFTGNDTTYFYSKLFKRYNRDDLLNHINMDITQFESGCRINLHKDLIKLDDNGNFIQEKFIELFKMEESKLYYNILNNRIDIFVYPICFYHSQIIKKIDFDLDKYQLYKIGLIATIYNIDYDEECLDHSYINQKLELLINIILKDIINSKKIKEPLFEFIKANIHERRILYETMKNLKVKIIVDA
jgi:hypothetical protein